MRFYRLSDLDLLSVGHEIQLAGAIYSGQGKLLLLPLVDEDAMEWPAPDVLTMDEAEWEQFLRQTDVLDVQGAKAILRKSQRQIDQTIAWKVYKRDGYRCRYCGREGPLTVDHIDLWEDGGATVEQNLVSACRRCNKTRGSMLYEKWMYSEEYGKLSKDLPAQIKSLNTLLIDHLY